MSASETDQPAMSVEIFAAKDSGELVMAVPWKCGLKEATVLRVADTFLIAMRNQSVLPIDLPPVSEEVKARLVDVANRGKQLTVGEFSALGLVDGYFLNLVVA